MSDRKYMYPTLRNAEIVTCLCEILNHPIQESSLVKAEPDTIRHIYEGLVEKLVGVSREELLTPVQDALETIEYPQLHELSIPEISFEKQLFKLMHAVGVEDFSIRDLVTPTWPRARKFLSACINFAKFREDKFLKYSELNVEGDRLLDERARAEDENRIMQDKLGLLKELVLGEEPESQALQREIQSIEQVLCDLNNTQAALVSDIHDTKEASKEIARKYEEVRKATELARRENEKLKSRIIRSPEKVKKHIAEMSVTLSKERQSLKDTERKQGEVQIRLQAIGKINKDIDKCIKILEEINIEQGKNKQEKKKIKEQKARLASMEDVLREVKNNQQSTTRQITSTKEKMGRLAEQHELRRKKQADMYDNARREKVEIEKDSDIMAQKIEQLALEMQKLQADDAMLNRYQEEQINALQGRVHELYGQLRTYHQHLATAMQPAQ